MKMSVLIVLAWILVIPNSVYAQENELKLWPFFAPGTEKRKNTERWDEKKQLFEVYQPRMIMFLPEKSDTCVPAIIICPGGGFKNLAVEKEGYNIARWLNQNGIAAFVLLYRLDPAEALQDAQRAVSLLRTEAEKYRLDKNRIGMIGFSAGANLSARLVTHFQKTKIHDAIDSISSCPNFWIGLYGAYEPIPKTKGINPYLSSFSPLYPLISQNTPPTFLVHAGNDPRAPVMHSVHLYEALKEHGVPAELHIYEQGEHGFALEKDRSYAVTSTVLSWSVRCIEWLKVRGILTERK